MDLLPADAQAFYCKPKPKFKNGDWYFSTPLGKNTLHNIMKNISKMAGWDQSKLWTGHSLRATAATNLLANNCDEAMVKQATGHRTSSALQNYVRGDKIRKNICNVLAKPAITENEKSYTGENLIQCSSSSNGVQKKTTLKRDSPGDFDEDYLLEAEMIKEADRLEKIQKVEERINFTNLNGCTINLNFK